MRRGVQVKSGVKTIWQREDGCTVKKNAPYSLEYPKIGVQQRIRVYLIAERCLRPFNIRCIVDVNTAK